MKKTDYEYVKRIEGQDVLVVTTIFSEVERFNIYCTNCQSNDIVISIIDHDKILIACRNCQQKEME